MNSIDSSVLYVCGCKDVVMTSIMSMTHKLELSRMTESQLRKMPPQDPVSCKVFS